MRNVPLIAIVCAAKFRKALNASLPFVLLAGYFTAPATAPAQVTPSAGKIIRLDPAFDAFVARDARVEKVATGFMFTEGPLWRPEEVLWFSDVPGNAVRSLTPASAANVIIPDAGGTVSAPPGEFIGPNGMIANRDGAVPLCQHGNRRIVRVGKNMAMASYIDKFEWRRLNSPNDLVYRSDGTLYFTDPPYGLTKQDADPAKELKFNGVFLYAHGALRPIITDLTGPNGIALSPDDTVHIENRTEALLDALRCGRRRLSVQRPSALRYSLCAGAGRSRWYEGRFTGEYLRGGPGRRVGLLPGGKHLGTIQPCETAANCAWGDDGKTLYITASTRVYRIRVSAPREKPLYQVYQ